MNINTGSATIFTAVMILFFANISSGGEIRPTPPETLRISAKDIRDYDLTQMAVVIGSEGRGVSQNLLTDSDKQLIIPMNSRCESLNAAVAATIVMWQMKR